MTVNAYSLLFLVIHILGGGASGQSYANVSNLETDLLSSYNKNIRPLENQTDVLNINVTLVIFAMPLVNNIEGSVVFTIQLYTAWRDELITWNPSDYGNTTEVVLPMTDVFVPQICFLNSLELEEIAMDWLKVKFNSDGTAFYDPGDSGTLTCIFYMKYWPFDKQICYISLFVYGFDTSKLTVTVSEPSVITKYLDLTGEWDVEKTTIETKIDQTYYIPQIHYKIKMSRRSSFYVLTMIVPIFTIGVLAGLVFFLPNDADTRVSYSMTNLLSLAVFLSVVTDDIPKGTEPVPLLCVLILYGVIVVGISTTAAIMNAIIFERSDDIPISKFYKRLVKITQKRKNKVKDDDNRHTYKDTTLTIHEENMSSNFKKLTDKEISNNIKENVSWQDVGKAIDKIMIILSLFVGHIPSGMLLIYICLGSHYNDRQTPF